jgi:predicted nucleotide-binding protein (sugar kinase/HSP70/actin superfamily)
MVSAWAHNNRLVLGQVKTDAKSNEITAIPELLKLLDIKPTFRTLFSNLGIYEKPHRTDVLPSSFQAL